MMDFIADIRQPPRLLDRNGAERRVGVEIEFAAVSARQGARIVADLFGGVVREEDAHRFHIENTEFGTFRSELDSQYAHRAYRDHGEYQGSFLDDFQMGIRRIYGDVSSAIVPCEIVCPPIAFSNVLRLDALVEKLRQAGAEGTRSNPFYAFGVQLNPEIASTDADYLTSMLKAYLLISPWLREVMSIDLTRRLVAFADPFPDHYVHRVLDEHYWPNLETLIVDYLASNPTRNRELDLLPLFAWIKPEIVRSRISDPRIKSRPAFHYRLPDANIEQTGWSIALEWNRWVLVERLAEDRELLRRMGHAFGDRTAQWFPQGSWAAECSQWLLLS
jgi:hypothetical protein